MTREQWLLDVAEALRPDFAAIAPIPANIRVSCGFPRGSRSGKGSKAIGQCWTPQASGDHPIDVLAHELVHAAIGLEAAHGKAFRRLAVAVGLTGKMTATTAGPLMVERATVIVAKLGSYPHAALTPETFTRAKQGTRMLKIQCPDCGYTARTTRQWLDIGLPVCPCGQGMEAT